MAQIFILDTNIVLYKIFCEVRVNDRLIWNKYEKFYTIKDELDAITNKGNKLVITPTVIGELGKLWEAQYDSFVYGKRFYKIKHKEVKNQIKKRIKGLIEKYTYKNLFDKISITDRNYNEILPFFEFFKEKLLEITNRKLRNLPPEIRERRLSYRKDGYMPEKSDLDILSECMYIRQNIPDGFDGVFLFTTDTDFISFKDEIEKLLHVGIHAVR